MPSFMLHKQKGQVEECRGAIESKDWETNPSSPRRHTIMAVSSQGTGELNQAVKVLELSILGVGGCLSCLSLGVSALEVQGQGVLPGSPCSALH